MTELAPHISMFLRHHMPQERNASRHTVGSYTDSFVLLSRFAADRLGIRPSAITIEHLSSELVLDFLDHLERDRGEHGPHAERAPCRDQVVLPIPRVPCTGLSRCGSTDQRHPDEAS